MLSFVLDLGFFTSSVCMFFSCCLCVSLYLRFLQCLMCFIPVLNFEKTHYLCVCFFVLHCCCVPLVRTCPLLCVWACVFYSLCLPRVSLPLMVAVSGPLFSCCLFLCLSPSCLLSLHPTASLCAATLSPTRHQSSKKTNIKSTLSFSDSVSSHKHRLSS